MSKINQTSADISPAQLATDGATLDDLVVAGAKPDELIAIIKKRAQDANREQQATLPAPPPMIDANWAARRDWLLDGQEIYGTMDSFYFPALAALVAGDQVEYSRQRDLAFKALRTMFGDPPPAAPTPEAPTGEGTTTPPTEGPKS